MSKMTHVASDEVVVKPKKWWKSKTTWVGILQVLGGIVSMPFLGIPVGTGIALKGAFDIALRVLGTSAPIKGSPADDTSN